MSTPQDVQAKLEAAVGYLKLTTLSYKQMAQKYGADWTKWGKATNWYLALSSIAAAELEVGDLAKKLTAAFKESSMSFTVNFSDQSVPGPSGPITAWHWDFGDGGTSTSQNPSHVYAAASTYTVVLTVTGTSPDGTNAISLPVTVVNPTAIHASFTESDVGLAATFTDTSTPGPSGPITAWSWNFGDGNTSSTHNPVHTYAAEGTYNATLTVTGTTPDGTSAVTNPVTVISGGSSFISSTNAARPAFTPIRTVNFSTKAGLDAAIAGMQPGDLIKYNGTGVLTISSSSGSGYAMRDKHPASPVMFDFGCSHNIWDTSKITPNYVAFRYTGTASFAAFYCNNLSNIRIFGGDYSTGLTGGTGFGGAIGNTHDCYFWDMYIHDCGTGGIGLIPKDGHTGTNTNIDGISVRVEVNDWGNDLAADSHQNNPNSPGTGMHACLCADAGGGFTNNSIAIYGHNAPATGSIIEIGSQIVKGSGLIANNHFYAKGEHLHFHPAVGTGSNILNLWGDKSLVTNRFGWIEGNDIYGTVMHTTGQPNTTGMIVDHGRASDTNLYPADGITVPYPSGHGIVYNDCI